MEYMAPAGFWFAAGYLAGSVPVGLVVGWLAGIDIRRYGTGNVGASNIFRNVGLLPAAAVGVTAFVQGLAPAWAAQVVTGSRLAVAAAAVGSVAGYAWSFMLIFRGGRAVATATGALAAISPAGLVPLLGMYALGGVARRPAPGVLLGLIAYVAYMRLWPHPVELVLAASVIVAIVILKRFDGVRDDFREEAGTPAEILMGRLVFDRKPGQRLVGRND